MNGRAPRRRRGWSIVGVLAAAAVAVVAVNPVPGALLAARRPR
ncbi:hypothetical protein SHIRM173S_08821 [Streptomyces hirsutus]